MDSSSRRKFILIVLIVCFFSLTLFSHSTNSSRKEPVFLSFNQKGETFLIGKNSPSAPKVITVLITAYTSRPEETDDTPFITASGKRVKLGIVASNFLPLGTKIKIPQLFGDQVFYVEDRMNPCYKDRIDIWLPSLEKAKRFGVKKAKVLIL